jgi:hypothetical protein
MRKEEMMKQESKAIVPVAGSDFAIAIPDYIKLGDERGRENVAREDLSVPRLAIAQAQSPQLVEGTAKYIESLKAGDMFNTVTGHNYGRSMDIVVVRHDAAHFIEFNPAALGEVLDFNVPANDPRTRFTEENGKTIKPRATKFLESLAYVMPQREPIALSFKGSGLKTGKHLRDLPNYLNVASFALVFRLTPMRKSEGDLNWWEFECRAVGPVDKDTYDAASEFYQKVKDFEMMTDREAPAADKDVPF